MVPSWAVNMDDLYQKIRQNPGNVSPKQLIELLKSYGFIYRKTEGDHEIYKKPGFRPFPVPIKKNPVWIQIVKEALRVIAEIRELQE